MTATAREWTSEQRAAIARRDGDLLLDAAAGSGKTSVLVERFVESVLEDGLDVASILTITFTEKAAAEMRERIRRRLRELGAVEAARETEGAFISTIDAFCARLLRVHALRAGIDPRFRVLDGLQAGRLADAAFDESLEAVGNDEPGGLDLIAAYGPWGLRTAIQLTYGQLRSAGQLEPRLPPLPAGPDLDEARERLLDAGAAAARELGAVDGPSARVVEALGRLETCSGGALADEPWPGDLNRLTLPGGNGAALSTAVCQEYSAALEAFRIACEHRWAGRAHGVLDVLLGRFGEAYTRGKREASGVDFTDLELMVLELVRGDDELRERLAARFERIMVDELQDTNPVQLELIELLARGNLFTVGDGQQSIYGFRHADVELFEARGRRLEELGARATLRTNFRSREEILTVVNRAFEHELGERYRALVAGRPEHATQEPRAEETLEPIHAESTTLEPIHAESTTLVELLVTDKGADWESDGMASPWRVAEAHALAGRVGELVSGGTAPGDVVVLLRAATDMRVYERALEERGIPTYVIGGRGYWAHPQVVDMVSYLRALANPRDVEALYTVLAAPLVGVSLDALVILAAAARSAGRDPWWVISDPEDRLDSLAPDDRDRLMTFAAWFADERRASSRLGVERLLDRVLELTGYEDVVLAMPGGQRRLANVRKLMRLGREQEPPGGGMGGDPLRQFLELVRFRSAGWSPPDSSEAEAPVEGDGLDAVRLMTIHRAKGLEFKIVCVADLGRGPRGRYPLMRIGSDGRFGLRLAQPGTARAEPALEYKALGDEQSAAEAAEERRLFYVAMTRAEDRLILSGAAKLDAWPANAAGGPIGWIGPAVVPELAALAEEREDGVAEGVAVRFFDEAGPASEPPVPLGVGALSPVDLSAPPAPPAAAPAAAVSELSYSSIEEHRRCGYRFYVERVLRLPGVEGPWAPGAAVVPAESDAEAASSATGAKGGLGAAEAEGALGAAERGGALGAAERGGALGAAERGILIHEVLERLDFKRPVLPDAEAIRAAAPIALSGAEVEDIEGLLRAFTASELCHRLGRATTARSEQRFAFLLGADPGVLIRGVFDVIAHEPGGRALVVDYKTDRIEGADPESVVAGAYATQRLIYALAALRGGAREVEVIHTFLERPAEPAVARFAEADVPRLEAELSGLAAPLVAGSFPVSDVPHRGLCQGCPAEGGLCSWPLSVTRRGSPDQLF